VKVNDADGNPIEIAAVVVWQVRDTARATYGVEDFVAFVDTQSETALRHVANGHPYDNAGSDALSLRDHTDEVAGQLASRSLRGSSRQASTSSRPGSPACRTHPRSLR
jgi:regulator of protease activity HflC (stomatin/prohibitin superfamily)